MRRLKKAVLSIRTSDAVKERKEREAKITEWLPHQRWNQEGTLFRLLLECEERREWGRGMGGELEGEFKDQVTREEVGVRGGEEDAECEDGPPYSPSSFASLRSTFSEKSNFSFMSLCSQRKEKTFSSEKTPRNSFASCRSDGFTFSSSKSSKNVHKHKKISFCTWNNHGQSAKSRGKLRQTLSEAFSREFRLDLVFLQECLVSDESLREVFGARFQVLKRKKTRDAAVLYDRNVFKGQLVPRSFLEKIMRSEKFGREFDYLKVDDELIPLEEFLGRMAIGILVFRDENAENVKKTNNDDEKVFLVSSFHSPKHLAPFYGAEFLILLDVLRGIIEAHWVKGGEGEGRGEILMHFDKIDLSEDLRAKSTKKALKIVSLVGGDFNCNLQFYAKTRCFRTSASHLSPSWEFTQKKRWNIKISSGNTDEKIAKFEVLDPGLPADHSSSKIVKCRSRPISGNGSLDWVLVAHREEEGGRLTHCMNFLNMIEFVFCYKSLKNMVVGHYLTHEKPENEEVDKDNILDSRSFAAFMKDVFDHDPLVGEITIVEA